MNTVLMVIQISALFLFGLFMAGFVFLMSRILWHALGGEIQDIQEWYKNRKRGK